MGQQFSLTVEDFEYVTEGIEQRVVDGDGTQSMTIQMPSLEHARSIAKEKLSENERVVAQLSDEQIEELATAIGEATSESVEENRQQLVEALNSDDTSKTQRALEIVVTSAVGRVVEYGFQNADVVGDAVIEILASAV